MRFCYPFALTASSRDSEEAPDSHKCIRTKSGVQCDQPCLIVFSPPSAFLREIARPDAVAGEFDRISVCT